MTKINGAFVPHRRALLKSPAWRALGIRERHILDRLEIEHATKGGAENGNLIVTKAQFEAFGIRRNAISESIRVLVALGFVVVEGRGRGGNGEFRTPSRYRLTYLPTKDAGPTDDWARVKSVTAAKEIMRAVQKKTDCRAPRWRPAPGPPLATVAGPPVGDSGDQSTGPPVGDSYLDTLPGDLGGSGGGQAGGAGGGDG